MFVVIMYAFDIETHEIAFQWVQGVFDSLEKVEDYIKNRCFRDVTFLSYEKTPNFSGCLEFDGVGFGGTIKVTTKSIVDDEPDICYFDVHEVKLNP